MGDKSVFHGDQFIRGEPCRNGEHARAPCVQGRGTRAEGVVVSVAWAGKP